MKSFRIKFQNLQNSSVYSLRSTLLSPTFSCCYSACLSGFVFFLGLVRVCLFILILTEHFIYQCIMLNSPCTLLFSFFPFYSPFSLLCSNFPPPLSKFVYFRSLSSLPFLCVHIPSTRGECFLANRSRLVFLEWYRMVNGKYYFVKSICYSGRQVRTLLPSCGALTLYAANT